LASGDASTAKVVYVEEGGTGHPRGEHVLGIVYRKGLTIALAKCGPIYSASTNNWYRMTSAKTQTVMIRQSIGYDGDIVHESYELRLDGSAGKADRRDRAPGVNGCQ
ncbi:MAG: hypothetical protein AB7R55_17080, partial [Gemmatimonadales bacterium]